MKKAHEFDFVLDCQAVYRKLLEAFANPGRPVDIADCAAKLPAPLGAHLAVAITLVDNETTCCVIGNDELSGVVRELTGGRSETMEKSSFVFVQPRCDNGQIASILAAVPAGTMVEPHTSCTVFVRVAGFCGEPGCTISGPGIAGTLCAPIGLYAEKWLNTRHGLELEYPCGIDLAFITDDGRILAVPRRVHPVA